MATELLPVHEEDMADVIRIIRAGLVACDGVPEHLQTWLDCWCTQQEEYQKALTIADKRMGED